MIPCSACLHRDLEAVRHFCTPSREVVGHRPERVTTDEHDASPRAIREMRGPEVVHLCSQYQNHVLEQDHRGITGHSRPMCGCGRVIGAARFYAAHEEVRDDFRHRTRLNEVIPLRVHREHFCARFTPLRPLVPVA